MPAKLSAALKVILKAPHAKGTAIPAPASAITEKLFNSLKTSAAANGLGSEAWLTLSVCSQVYFEWEPALRNVILIDSNFGNFEFSSEFM